MDKKGGVCGGLGDSIGTMDCYTTANRFECRSRAHVLRGAHVLPEQDTQHSSTAKSNSGAMEESVRRFWSVGSVREASIFAVVQVFQLLTYRALLCVMLQSWACKVPPTTKIPPP